MNIRMRILIGSLLALTLAALGALHITWATGSPFPAENFDQLSAAVTPGDGWPPPSLTLIVAAGLCGMSVATILRMFDLFQAPTKLSPLLRLASYAIATVFLLRSVIGFVLSSGSWPVSPADAVFFHWDLWLYSPLCLALALSAWAIAAPRTLRPAEQVSVPVSAG